MIDKVKQWFLIMVVTAFISVISFFQIDSWYADLHNLNGMWFVSGLVFGAAAVYALFRTKGHSN